MTQDEIKIYDVMIAVMGDQLVTNIGAMNDSDKISWVNCVKVLGYKKIIRQHLLGKTPEEIAEYLSEDARQVSRIIYRYNRGLLTA